VTHGLFSWKQQVFALTGIGEPSGLSIPVGDPGIGGRHG